MTGFSQRIRPHVDAELAAATSDETAGRPHDAFKHLERAHVLGQASTAQHVRVHWEMFRWGWRQHDLRECAGQLLRIAGAATKTAIGLVPHGNTGGTNISPFKRLPVPPELEQVIQSARTDRS